MYTDGSNEDKRSAMSFVCDDHEFSCRIYDEDNRTVMIINLAVVSTMRLQSAQQNY